MDRVKVIPADRLEESDVFLMFIISVSVIVWELSENSIYWKKEKNMGNKQKTFGPSSQKVA